MASIRSQDKHTNIRPTPEHLNQIAAASGVNLMLTAVKRLNRLNHSKLCRGPTFYAQGNYYGVAKCRSEVLQSIVASTNVGKFIAVVWRFRSKSCKTWIGKVSSKAKGFLWIQYDAVKQNYLFPFPPTDPNVEIIGVRLESDAQSQRLSGRTRKRLGAGKPNSTVVQNTKARNVFRLVTSNVCTLRLHGHDRISILRCLTLHRILSWMSCHCVDCACIQETRFGFSEKSVVRQLRLNRESFELHFQTSEHGQGGLLTILRNLTGTSEPFEARLQSLRIHADTCLRVINAHLPHQGHDAQHIAHWVDKLLEMHNNAQESLRVVCGDLNMPLFKNRFTPSLSQGAETLRSFLTAANMVSNHQIVPRKKFHTFVSPKGFKSQLDHILICRRFQTAMRRPRIYFPPWTAQKYDHLAVQVDLAIKWRVQHEEKKHIPWFQLQNKDIAKTFVENVKQFISIPKLSHVYEDPSFVLRNLPPRTKSVRNLQVILDSLTFVVHPQLTEALCSQLYANIREISPSIALFIYHKTLDNFEKSEILNLLESREALTDHCDQLQVFAQSKDFSQHKYGLSLITQVQKDIVQSDYLTTIKQIHEEIVGFWKSWPLSSHFSTSLTNAISRAAHKIPEHEKKLQESVVDNEILQSMSGVYHIARKKETWKSMTDLHKSVIEEVVRKEAEELTRSLRHNPARAWRYVNTLTKGPRYSLQLKGISTQDKLRRALSHFKTLGGNLSEQIPVIFSDAPVVQKISDACFTLEELHTALKQFERGRTPGSDNIPIEGLRAICSDAELSLLLLRILNMPLETGFMPDDWRVVMQIPIPKKGDLSQIENWRNICLVNVIAKLHNRLIFNRIVPAVNEVLRPNQFGFRPNRSTVGAMCCFEEITTKARRADEGLIGCFVDFSKAFPSISFQSIEEALRAFHIPPKIANAIMSQYRGIRAFVRTPIGDTESFDIETGTLQGDVLAPFLFVMVLDRVLYKTLEETNGGFSILPKHLQGTKSRPTQNDKRICDINYADDLVLFTKTLPQLETLMLSLVKNAREVNLHLNVGVTKTAWMTFGRVPQTDGLTEFFVEGIGKVPRVTNYKYLGNEKGTVVDSWRTRLQIAWGATHKLSHLWNMPIGVHMKLRFFDAVVMPLLHYGSASWVLSKKVIEHIDKEVHRMRRKVCNVKSWDPIRQTGVHLESLYGDTPRFSTRHVIEKVTAVGHLLRMDTPMSYALLWQPRGKAKPVSLSESVANLFGIDSLELYDWTKKDWAAGAERLRKSLEVTPRYTFLWEKIWERHRAQSQDYDALQYVEEGSKPFVDVSPSEDTIVTHYYTDGSRIGKNSSFITGAGFIAFSHALPFRCFMLPCFEMSQDLCTNNRAELQAFRGALLHACLHRNLLSVIHTDSNFVWNFWHLHRRRRRLSHYCGMDHCDILVDIDEMSRHLNVKVIKVRAHNGNVFNEDADETAGYAVNTASFWKYGPNGPKWHQVTIAPNKIDAVKTRTDLHCGHMVGQNKCSRGECRHSGCGCERLRQAREKQH